MISWIIYNGSNEIEKVNNAAKRFLFEMEKMNIKGFLIKNSEILLTIEENGEINFNLLLNIPKADFIIFWDKDVLLAKALEKKGFLLFNCKSAVEICDNKALMHIELAKKNIPMPKTIIAPFAFYNHKLDENYYNNIVLQIGKPFVLKESGGSFGMQVYMINNYLEFKEKINSIGNKSFIMQQFINKKGKFFTDLRINIVGNKIFGAMIRTNENDFRANISNGGVGTIVNLTKEQKEIALLAHKTLGLTFSGVDLLFSENKMLLCEVNSNVNFISYENLSGKNFSKEVLLYILGELNL